MRKLHEQIFRCIVGACDETCTYYKYDEKEHICCNSYPEFANMVEKYFKNIDKVREDLRYYADVNEELGIVYIPKFMVEKMIGRL